MGNGFKYIFGTNETNGFWVSGTYASLNSGFEKAHVTSSLGNSANGQDCYAIPVDSGEYISIATSQANELNPQFSPDGKWVAFESDESGRFEIYVISWFSILTPR
jgi:Tol biopolymer transport system component